MVLSKNYHYWNSALGSQRGALFFFLPKSNIFYFVLSVPSSQTLWKKLKEEKSVSSGACLWKEIKILSKWNLKTARSQVAGKVVPPLTQGTTVQLSTEGTRNSRWTPQAQKKFSPFIWHRNKFFLFQVKGKKKAHRSLPSNARFFFFLQMPPSSVLIPRCPQHKPHLAHSVHDPLRPCAQTANANRFSSLLYSCFSAADSILPASLCLHFTTYSKGFLLCVRDSQGLTTSPAGNIFSSWSVYIETLIVSSCSIPELEQTSCSVCVCNRASSFSKPLLWLIANWCLPPEDLC